MFIVKGDFLRNMSIQKKKFYKYIIKCLKNVFYYYQCIIIILFK